MCYTNLLLLLVFIGLAGCASGPSTPYDEDGGAGSNIGSATAEEVILYRKGISALYKNELDEAELMFLKIIKMQPDLAGPWANLGLVYMKQGHMNKAKKNALIALEKNPKMAQAYGLLGYIAKRDEHILEAIGHYEKAVNYKPDYALAHYNLALLYDTYLQDLASAIKHYELYLKIIDYKDETTAQWVEELKRNLERKSS